MRWLFVGALAACGTSSPAKPVGSVTVTVFSDAGHSTDFVTEGKPIPGAMVFEEGGAPVMTDDNGVATLGVMHDPATIHVASTAPARDLTTIAGVPVGGHAYLGNRPYFMSVGSTGVSLQDIGATSYDVAAPSCMAHGGISGNHVGFTYTSACGQQVVTLVGIAVTTTGTKVVEQDVAVLPNMPPMLGAFTDATVYAPTPTNLPALPGAPSVKIGVVGTNGWPLTLPTLAGPADANRVILSAGDASAGSTLVVTGPIGATVDASHMIPVPDIGTVDEHGAAWSIPPSAAQPDVVELDIIYGMTGWRVFAPPSMTSVAFPQVPPELAAVTPAQPATSVKLRVVEMPRAVLTTDELEGSFDSLTAPLRADHQPVANSYRAL